MSFFDKISNYMIVNVIKEILKGWDPEESLHNQLNDTQMLEVRTVVTDVPLVWASVSQSVCLSVTLATLLTHSPDGATSMQPLLHYCNAMSTKRCHRWPVATRDV